MSLPKTILFLLIGLFTGTIFQSCLCKHSIVDTYVPSEEEKDFNPYQQSQSVKFRHSGGTLLTLDVKERSMQTQDMKLCKEGCCGYDRFTWESTKIESDTAGISIFMSLNSQPVGNNYHYIITVNESEFDIPHPLGSCTADTNRLRCLDSVSIAGNTYRNAYYLPTYSHLDSLHAEPSALIYTKEEGIVQIQMTDGESYSLVP